MIHLIGMCVRNMVAGQCKGTYPVLSVSYSGNLETLGARALGHLVVNLMMKKYLQSCTFQL